MSTVIRASKPDVDDLPRTDWFSYEVRPTIAGEYEAQTGGGHVFRRRWDGQNWRNAITDLVSTAPIPWRGIQPGAVQTALYPRDLRDELQAGLQRLREQKADELVAKGEEVYARTGGTAPSDTHAAATGALYS